MSQLNLFKNDSSPKCSTRHLHVHRPVSQKPTESITCLIMSFREFEGIDWTKITIQRNQLVV